MVKIKEVAAVAILDSRKDKTIQVTIKTNVGKFSASAPQGKSTGKFEKKLYRKSINEDIKTLKKISEYFSDENLESFNDLRKIEAIVEGHVGANTILALEYAVLKAIAKEQKKQVWQLINKKAKKMPRLVGNVIGGGKHSHSERKPDFQEFLLIPNTKTLKQSFELNKKAKAEAEFLLKERDNQFKSKQNDENAWITSLNEKLVLDILYRLKQKFKLDIGLDVAASSFYKRGKYNYENPKLKRSKDEQLNYVSNLIKNFNLLYIEDPIEENDFNGFAELLKKSKNCLIVGDDLIVTSSNRLKKATKSISAIIIKPNQCGSLLEVREVCELAKKHNIKTVFSHRSGETSEDILSDLAVGFEADFFKCGIDGDVREAKLKRLIEIERKL